MGLEPGSSWCSCRCTASGLSLGDRVPSLRRQWASSASSSTIRVTMGSSTGWAYPKTLSCGRDTACGWEFITRILAVHRALMSTRVLATATPGTQEWASTRKHPASGPSGAGWMKASTITSDLAGMVWWSVATTCTTPSTSGESDLKYPTQEWGGGN